MEGTTMHAVVLEHVPVAELPPAWRDKLGRALTDVACARVTVRIEAEEQSTATAAAAEQFVTDDPAFGIWRDREEMADVEAYVRHIRAPRFNRDGSRNEQP
jgi:hypothetical protein